PFPKEKKNGRPINRATGRHQANGGRVCEEGAGGQGLQAGDRAGVSRAAPKAGRSGAARADRPGRVRRRRAVLLRRPAGGRGDGQGGKNIGALILESGTPGFTILRNDLNMAGELQSQLLFDNCRVPKENVLVTGNAFGRLIRIYNRNRLSGVAQALGMATASL